MSERVHFSEVLKRLESTLSLEVKCYDNEFAIITKVTGIRRGMGGEELKLVKRYRGKRKISNRQMSLLTNICERLLNAKVLFKVVFGSNDVIVRFDVDHYIHIYPNEIRIIGYTSLDERPLIHIKEVLRNFSRDFKVIQL